MQDVDLLMNGIEINVLMLMNCIVNVLMLKMLE